MTPSENQYLSSDRQDPSSRNETGTYSFPNAPALREVGGTVRLSNSSLRTGQRSACIPVHQGTGTSLDDLDPSLAWTRTQPSSHRVSARQTLNLPNSIFQNQPSEDQVSGLQNDSSHPILPTSSFLPSLPVTSLFPDIVTALPTRDNPYHNLSPGRQFDTNRYLLSTTQPSMFRNSTQSRQETLHQVSSQSNVNRNSYVTENPQTGKTFDGLVDDIRQHQLLPLILKRAYESSLGISPFINDQKTKDELRRASRKSEFIEDKSRRAGVQEALKQVDTVDFFFCLLNAALKSLAADFQPPISSILHNTLSSCAQLPKSRGQGTDSPTTTVGSPIEQTYDPTLAGSARPKLSDYARNRLDEWFNDNFQNPYPTKEQKLLLARDCGIKFNQVSSAQRYKSGVSLTKFSKGQQLLR